MVLQMVGTMCAGLVGAIIGSFLNVVIYRLPRDLSVSNPRWSMCPHCGARIRPYDNIPILGWLLLKGRCRDCRAPISSMYPVVEGLTSLAFLTVWDAFFIAQIHGDWANVLLDWPMLVAGWMLVAVLISVSVMDIDAYMLDVRPLWLSMGVGVLMFVVWFTMRGTDLLPDDFFRELPSTDAASSRVPLGGLTPLPPSIWVIGTAMGAAWVLTEFVRSLIAKGDNAEADAAAEIPSEQTAQDSGDDVAANSRAFRPIPVMLLGLAIIALIGVQVLSLNNPAIASTEMAVGLRGWVVCLVLMAAVVLASMTHRAVDDEIIEEIEAERATARTMVLREFGVLMPAVLIGLVLFVFFKSTDRLGLPFDALPLFRWLEGTSLLMAGGLCCAITAMVFGAAVGWSVRIGGTLLFGKEAFGTGDIYILAAIGACLGAWAAFFSLFLGVLLALLGVVLTLFSKTSRAIPFGPWLGLGALAYVWLAPDLMAYFQPAVEILWDSMTGRFP